MVSLVQDAKPFMCTHGGVNSMSNSLYGAAAQCVAYEHIWPVELSQSHHCHTQNHGEELLLTDGGCVASIFSCWFLCYLSCRIVP